MTRAFTLIELLIVVAIIAILAAIAVPNFLEAQTRAKVSRVYGDMRTMRTAIEAYHVDNTAYPRMAWGCFFGDYWTTHGVCEPINGNLAPGPAADCAGVKDPRGMGGCITTPVAYLTTLFYDPFNEGQRASIDSRFYTYWNLDNYIELGNLLTCGFSLTLPVHLRDDFENAFGKYMLWSIGPQGYRRFAIHTRLMRHYDPTNGTYSDGAIYVGQKSSSFVWVDQNIF